MCHTMSGCCSGGWKAGVGETMMWGSVGGRWNRKGNSCQAMRRWAPKNAPRWDFLEGKIEEVLAREEKRNFGASGSRKAYWSKESWSVPGKVSSCLVLENQRGPSFRGAISTFHNQSISRLLWLCQSFDFLSSRNKFYHLRVKMELSTS